MSHKSQNNGIHGLTWIYANKKAVDPTNQCKVYYCNSYIIRKHKRVTDYCRFLVNLRFSLANLVFFFHLTIVQFDRYTNHKIISQKVMEMHFFSLQLDTCAVCTEYEYEYWCILYWKRRKWDFFFNLVNFFQNCIRLASKLDKRIQFGF